MTFQELQAVAKEEFPFGDVTVQQPPLRDQVTDEHVWILQDGLLVSTWYRFDDAAAALRELCAETR